MSVIFYSQRLLNPFRGMMNIIELDQADAVTTDGTHWMLYVHDEEDRWKHHDNLQAQVITPDIHYGRWTKAGGLKKSPRLSNMNHSYIEHAQC